MSEPNDDKADERQPLSSIERDARPRCPVCAEPLEEAGRTLRCTTCEGAWIAEDALVAILESRASTLVNLPWAPREDQPRPCAECRIGMQTVDLGSVQLDRCALHGVWFDANELTTLLRQVSRFKTLPPDDAEEPKQGLLQRLANLFS